MGREIGWPPDERVENGFVYYFKCSVIGTRRITIVCDEKIAVFKLEEDSLLGLFNANMAVKNKSWAEIYAGDQLRQRGIVIAQVIYQDHLWYLFDLEPNKNDLADETKGFSLLARYIKNKELLSNTQLYEFMRECVKASGWPKFTAESALIFKETRLNHTWGLKERLMIKMKNQMGK